jgi:hypothetical protein
VTVEIGEFTDPRHAEPGTVEMADELPEPKFYSVYVRYVGSKEETKIFYDLPETEALNLYRRLAAEFTWTSDDDLHYIKGKHVASVRLVQYLEHAWPW